MTDTIPCDLCGHAIEGHDLRGCIRCACADTWTKSEIQTARKREGLPSKYSLTIVSPLP